MFRRRYGVFLLAVTWIAVATTSPAHNARPSRQPDFGECCPCPGPAGRLSDTELDALPDASTSAAVAIPDTGRSAAGCPCCQREADSLGAASGPIPGLARAAGPFVMPSPSEPKGEGKPLLHPEVGLASSVLETLREATDEEYKDALERDAARSAAADENSLEGSRNIVTIILNPTTQSTERVDDTDVAGTHTQEARCIQSPLESSRTISELAAPQNFQEDIVGIPRFQNSGLFKGKLLPFDGNPSASEARESVVHAPAQNMKPPLLKLLSDDKLHLDKQGVKDLMKVYKMSKDILDENAMPIGEKSSDYRLGSDTVPDFGINTKISDLNERIDQLNDLNELTKIPKLKIDEKYSKVTKGAEQLEESEEMTNADSLQAPSDREDTASPASDIQNLPEFRTNQLQKLNQEIRKSVPDLIKSSKNLLKLKDVELIPSSSFSKASLPRQNKRPNIKLLSIEEIISRAKAINLRDLIPNVASSTTPGSIDGPDVANALTPEVTQNGDEIKGNFDDSNQNFETEIIDAVPSSSISQATRNINGEPSRVSKDALECKTKLNENIKESQTNPRTEDNVATINHELQDDNDDNAKQEIFAAESDDDFESDTSDSADRSLDVDRGTGLNLADKLERLSDTLKKSDVNSKSVHAEHTIQKNAKDAEGAESRNAVVIKLSENEYQVDNNKKNRKQPAEYTVLASSESPVNSQAEEQLRFKPRIVTDNLPVRSAFQEETKTAGGNMAPRTYKTSADICTSNVEEKDSYFRTSKNVETKEDDSDIPTNIHPFKKKSIRTSTDLNTLKSKIKNKEPKNIQEKNTDMTAAASERVNNFLSSNPIRQRPEKSRDLPGILRSESNLQAPGPWTLWSGLEHERSNKHPRLSPEKFKDLFEGLSRARVNDGTPGLEGPLFPQSSRFKSHFEQDRGSIRLPMSSRDEMSSVLRSRLKSPFKQQKGPKRPFLLSGLTIDEMSQGLPTLDEMRSRAHEFLSSPKLGNTGIQNLENLRAREPIKQLEDLRENLHNTAANAVSNLQQTLSSTLEVAKIRDGNLLANSLYAQPENVLDTLSKARFDVDDRLKSIHTNVLGRLSSINERLSKDAPPLNFPRAPILRSAKMQDKSASENQYRITSPKTPVARFSSRQVVPKQISESRQNKPIVVQPVRFSPPPTFDLPKFSHLPWDTNKKLSSRNNDNSLKTTNARKSYKVVTTEPDISANPIPIVRKYIKKPKERTAERTSTTSHRNTAPRPDLRVRPLQPTPEIRRTQIKKPSKSSPETKKWKMALATTPLPTDIVRQRTSMPLLKSSLDRNANPLPKLTFDPKERLQASLKSQRDSMGASSQNILSKTDAINERLKNSLAMHRQKAQENAKARATALKPVVKVNISKMELPERTAFKDLPIGNIQKRDSETEEEDMGEPKQILSVKPLAKSAKSLDFIDKLKQSVRTTLSSAGLKPTLDDREASKLQMKPEMMEGASEVFKSMIDKANDPMKENIAYQCRLVCNKE